MVILAAGVILTACGPQVADDERDRRFAEQSRPPVATATVADDDAGTPVPRGTDRPPGTPAPITPSELLVPQGGASAAFFQVDGHLLIATAAGSLVTPELPGTIVAMSVAPAGDRVALLLDTRFPHATPAARSETPAAIPADLTGDDMSAPIMFGDAHVLILGADGEALRTIDDLADLAGIAASEGVSGDGVTTIALGPGPDDLLVGLADGLLVHLPETAEPIPIPGSGNLSDIRQVSWAPDGSGIAITASDAPGGPTALYYTAIRADGIDPVRLAPGAGRTIGDATWMPDGTGILFTDAAGPVSTATLRQGRDLFVSRLRTDRRDLVVAAGVIGPSAGVVRFVSSPDGLLAYTLVRVEGDAVRFNSLRVGRIGTSDTIEVRLPSAATVVALAWTSAGLMVLTVDDSGSTVVHLVGSDGTPAALDAAPERATPSAAPTRPDAGSSAPSPRGASAAPQSSDEEPTATATVSKTRPRATATATPDRVG